VGTILFTLMKTIATLALIAAAAAFTFAQFSFETAVSLLFVAGFASIVANDYLRPRLVFLMAAKSPRVSVRRERFGLAA
jgi:hypothetical protein